MSVTDFPDWMSVAQQNAALQATGIVTGTPGGVNLLAVPVEVTASTPITVPAATVGQVVNLAGNAVTFVNNYLTYEIHARFSSVSASTVPFSTFLLTWYADAAASVPLYRERWTVATNAVSGGTSIFGTGPVRGAYMQLTVTNEDPTNAMTINGLQIVLNSRPFPNISPDWRTVNPQESIPSYLVPTIGNSDDGILGIVSAVSIPANTTDNFVFGLFNGSVSVTVEAPGAGTINLAVTPTAFVSGSGGRSQVGNALSFTSGGSQSEMLNLPRSNLILQCANALPSTAQTINIAVVAASQF